MKTKRQIILETAAYYGEDPSRRGLSVTQQCTYVNNSGQMCAIGRLMTASGLKVYHLDDSTPASDIHNSYIRPEYREALEDEDFADELQNFHDNDEYWNDNGLTGHGQLALSDMLDRWSN